MKDDEREKATAELEAWKQKHKQKAVEETSFKLLKANETEINRRTTAGKVQVKKGKLNIPRVSSHYTISRQCLCEIMFTFSLI